MKVKKVALIAALPVIAAVTVGSYLVFKPENKQNHLMQGAAQTEETTMNDTAQEVASVVAAEETVETTGTNDTSEQIPPANEPQDTTPKLTVMEKAKQEVESYAISQGWDYLDSQWNCVKNKIDRYAPSGTEQDVMAIVHRFKVVQYSRPCTME